MSSSGYYNHNLAGTTWTMGAASVYCLMLEHSKLPLKVTLLLYLEGQKYLNNSEGWGLSSLRSQSSDRREKGWWSIFSSSSSGFHLTRLLVNSLSINTSNFQVEENHLYQPGCCFGVLQRILDSLLRGKKVKIIGDSVLFQIPHWFHFWWQI